MDRGVQRVLVGVQVLQSREDVAGYSAFAERDYWKRAGIDGWKQNPIFGYGTEAFRDDYGITSHSTPIDLLYDHGLIGLVLFYSVFASLMWRLLQLEHRRFTGQRSLIFAGVVCYVFVSLSGTVHYNSFLAAFIGISSALLARYSVSRASTLAASK
jgi:O-antigen ligase